MAEYNLYAHPEKCHFYLKNVLYLGLGISSDGIYITEDSKKTIRDWPVPQPGQQNKKMNRRPNPDGKTSIRTFLGMINFFRKFIKRLAEKSRPISDLLASNKKFTWGPEQQAAFDLLKEELLSSK